MKLQNPSCSPRWALFLSVAASFSPSNDITVLETQPEPEAEAPSEQPEEDAEAEALYQQMIEQQSKNIEDLSHCIELKGGVVRMNAYDREQELKIEFTNTCAQKCFSFRTVSLMGQATA